jgi:tetraacyldisaccharide 4'-kinase
VNPISAIFSLAVGARNALYDHGILTANRLRAPVVSVGNLSMGGSGKTPLVMALGELLKARGIGFDVLSRGYGRRSRGIALVDGSGGPEDYGDEPLLIARRLGVPVVVGESRYAAGVFSERKFGPQLHLLDDGFQHRRLARDFEIVLLRADDRGARLLPFGRLREPLSALGRADAVVVPEDLAVGPFRLENQLVWRIRRGIVPGNMGQRPLLFCGIARPLDLLNQIRGLGIEPAATRFYRDHHRYSLQDVELLTSLARESAADGFVTTEKDAVNLGSLRSALAPLAIAAVRLELLAADDAVDTMLRVIDERRHQGMRKS